MINSRVLAELDRLALEKNNLDIMSDFTLYLNQEWRLVKPYIVDAFWYDLGSTEKYGKLTNELVQRYLEELGE